jgi:hypothetical protein
MLSDNGEARGQGQRKDIAAMKDWTTIIDGKGDKPAKEQIVVGYWISGPEKFAEACWYDKEHGKWYSGQTGDELHEPDYWVMKPENYAKDGCL